MLLDLLSCVISNWCQVLTNDSSKAWCAISGSYFPWVFGCNNFRDDHMANESCPQELSTEGALPSLSNAFFENGGMPASKMNGHLCIIFFENWIEDLWCSLTWHTSHLSCWHIALYSTAHGAFDDVSEAGNRCLCAVSIHLLRKIQY